MSRPMITMTGTIGMLLTSGLAWAFLSGKPLEMRRDFLIVHVDGTARRVCEQAPPPEVIGPLAWSLDLTMVPADDRDRRRSPADDYGVVCARADSADESGTDPAGAGRLSATGSIRYAVTRQMENERTVVVTVRGKATLLAGAGETSPEDRHEAEIDRRLTFSQDDSVLVPLWSQGGGRGNIPGVSEVYLVITVHEPRAPEDTRFGSIWIMTGGPGLEVFLDGGLVGQAGEAGDLHLANVLAGVHIVEIGRPDGTRLRRAVRVHAGRRAVADFADEHGAQATYTLRPLGTNAQGFHEFERSRDGATVVDIPAGEFLMGNVETERSPPEHMVYLSGYLMDKTGVTWGQYKRFAAHTGIALPPHTPYWGIVDDQPAVYVTWEESKAYCEWAGGRLPTEAEREKAARGLDGRMYPWGNQEPNEELGVFRRSWGYSGPAKVATHPAGISPYGLHDMGGNVWEWCSDWYDDEYLKNSPYRDPRGPASGISHVVRGGSWDSRPSVLSASCRNWGHVGYRDGDFGFRCAMNAPE